MEQSPNNFIINEYLLNNVIAYLSHQPYREVAGLLSGLGQLRPFGPQVAAPKPQPQPEPTKAETKPEATKSKSQEKREAIQTAAKKV